MGEGEKKKKEKVKWYDKAVNSRIEKYEAMSDEEFEKAFAKGMVRSGFEIGGGAVIIIICIILIIIAL